MKRKILLLWILLVPAFLVAQEEKDTATVEMETLYDDLGVGRQFNFEEASVNFIKVISDSRCPKKVLCVWAGEAKVLLGIRLDGKYFEKEVVVSGGGAEIPLPNDLLMQVSHLRPYPETGAKIASEEYCLRFSAIFPAEDQ